MMKSISLFLLFLIQASLYSGEHVKISREMLVEISDELIRGDLAEVDIDPEAFEVKPERPKTWKKDAFDDIEFISEREPTASQ